MNALRSVPAVRIEQLPTGAEARICNEGGRLIAVLVNGGTAKPVPGTWSATSELLAVQLAPRFPNVSFVEVRYRVKTWKALDSCIAGCRGGARACRSNGARAALLVGFSMGGAVAISVVGRGRGCRRARPRAVDPARASGRRSAPQALRRGARRVGSRSCREYRASAPGIRGRRGNGRGRLGAEGTYSVIPRGLHGCAVRSRRGGLVRLPRWRAWVEQRGRDLERFAADASLMYRFLQLSVGTLVRLVWRLRVDGADRMPAGGGRTRVEPRVGARPVLPRGGVPAAAALPGEGGAVANPSRRPGPGHLRRDPRRSRPRRPGGCGGGRQRARRPARSWRCSRRGRRCRIARGRGCAERRGWRWRRGRRCCPSRS